jgi:uncharacterized repeat protein (TIGR03803 family)
LFQEKIIFVRLLKWINKDPVVKRLVIIAISIALVSSCEKEVQYPPGTGSYNDIYNFSGSTGNSSYGTLVLSGTTFYGMTYIGGANSGGTIFSINMDGTGYTDMFDFNSISGESPYGNLTLVGTAMYGMTNMGGAHNEGTIFTINTNGSGFKVLYNFGPSDTNGVNTFGDLVVSGNNIYGITFAGGVNGSGNIFSVHTNGGGYKNVYSFPAPGFNSILPNPGSSLLLSGSTLYGTTFLPNGSSGGYIYAIDTNGSGLKIIHTFTNGAGSSGALAISGNTLYGVSYIKGAYGYGFVFAVNTDSSGYKDIYDFNALLYVVCPQGSLIISGNTMYGITGGNLVNYGSIFSLHTDGSGFIDLYNFYNATGDYPVGSLLLSNNILYGIANEGGANNDGVIFSYKL